MTMIAHHLMIRALPRWSLALGCMEYLVGAGHIGSAMVSSRMELAGTAGVGKRSRLRLSGF